MIAMLLLLLAAAPAEAASAPPARATPMRKARDPDIAVHQELCAARKAGTLAAYDLFIARHPRHALAATARAERDALARRNK